MRPQVVPWSGDGRRCLVVLARRSVTMVKVLRPLPMRKPPTTAAALLEAGFVSVRVLDPPDKYMLANRKCHWTARQARRTSSTVSADQLTELARLGPRRRWLSRRCPRWHTGWHRGSHARPIP